MKKIRLLLLFLIVQSSGNAFAAMVKVDFAGQINSLSVVTATGSVFNSAAVSTFDTGQNILSLNDTFTGSFIYDTLADELALSASLPSSEYALYSAVSSMNVQLGSDTLTDDTNGRTMTVSNDRSAQKYDGISANGLQITSQLTKSFGVNLLSLGDLFSNLSIPTSLGLSDFDINLAQGSYTSLTSNVQYYWSGNLTQLSSQTLVNGIPLPPLVLLIVLAAGGLLYRHRGD